MLSGASQTAAGKLAKQPYQREEWRSEGSAYAQASNSLWFHAHLAAGRRQSDSYFLGSRSQEQTTRNAWGVQAALKIMDRIVLGYGYHALTGDSEAHREQGRTAHHLGLRWKSESLEVSYHNQRWQTEAGSEQEGGVLVLWRWLAGSTLILRRERLIDSPYLPPWPERDATLSAVGASWQVGEWSVFAEARHLTLDPSATTIYGSLCGWQYAWAGGQSMDLAAALYQSQLQAPIPSRGQSWQLRLTWPF